jgi:phosphohistidine swiveling domain-containing protein
MAEVGMAWVPLSSIGLTHIREVGGKAARLGELARAGFPVPDGFVLPARLAGCEREATEAVHAALGTLSGSRLAVRSSGLAEDLEEASFAGQYETVLGVEGPDAVMAAVRRCWDSASTERVRTYANERASGKTGRVAVLVQRLVDAVAAGVAYSTNPLTGDRAEVVVNAVRGLGDRLVSGQADADEWIVRDGSASQQRHAEGAIDAAQAIAIADLARRAAAQLGGPQDIEWAIAGADLHLLQSRPITALPELVSWQPTVPGGYVRNFRLGEWLGDPVTPLFESWLLSRMQRRFHDLQGGWISMPWREPAHIVINGWYYYSVDIVPSGTLPLLRFLLRRVIPNLAIRPRRAVMVIPPLAYLGVDLFIKEWREAVLPNHRALVEDATALVDRARPEQLVEMIDRVATDAGDYFTSITAVAGFAWKAEVPLARFYRKHLHPRIGGSYAELLQGLYTSDANAAGHAVQSLDWFHPTLSEVDISQESPAAAAERRQRLGESRRAAEGRARAALKESPKLRARFERMLALAQRFQPLREEQVSYLTLGWPVMRRALQRIGTQLTEAGVIDSPEQVYFLRHEELLAAVAGGRSLLAPEASRRRATWDRQRTLSAPLFIGTLPPLFARLQAHFEWAVRVPGGTSPGLKGVPASPGRARGPARIIRSLEDIGRLQPGDVLVAPVTTPAWTPLFARAAAVVTDTGGVGSHASQVAREYGIPAVVGTGDATARLRDGEPVTVDGGTGVVEI